MTDLLKKLALPLLLAIGLASCAKASDDRVSSQSPSPLSGTQQLRTLYSAALARAEGMRSPDNGWLVTDGDGMLWTGLYAAAPEVKGVNLAASEGEPGKFCRYPSPDCWALKTDATTWSRDMAMGLLWAAWRTEAVALLKRHVSYGRSHQTLGNGVPVWRMGDPLDDGRTLYSPALVGEVFQVLHALGASDSQDRLWPNVYPQGLTDYQAHIQVLGILLRGEIDGVGPFGFAPEGDITATMFERLKDHAQREPEMPLYSFALGRYTGDQNRAMALCSRGPEGVPNDSFVRCHDFERCSLAAWLFACGSLLSDLEKADAT